jgi:hypothetical protein
VAATAPTETGNRWWLGGYTTRTSSTSPLQGIGYDASEVVYAGGKFISRTQTVPNQAPLVRIDQTATHTGGTAGAVVSTLKLNTLIPAEGADVNNSIWGMTSVITSSGTGSGNPVAGYFQGIRPATALSDGRGIRDSVFGLVSDVQDLSQGTSDVAGSLIGAEFDITANGLDPALRRNFLDFVLFKGPGGAPAEAGGGLRLQTGANAGYTVGHYQKGISIEAPFSLAGIDTSLSVAATYVAAATVAAGGSGGTDGTYTATGTTGTFATPFQANVTVSDGTVTAVNSISVPGAYWVNPTVPTNEPVSGPTGFPTGAALSVTMDNIPTVRLAYGQGIAFDANNTYRLEMAGSAAKYWRFRNGSSVKMSLDTSGNMMIAGGLTVSSGYVTFSNSAPTVAGSSCTTHQVGVDASNLYVCTATNTWMSVPLQAFQSNPILPATTGSIGGGALTAGACTSGTVAVSGATTSMAVTATPATYPGDGIFWNGYVSSAGTVTVKVCAAAAGTPTASAYNVRVIQ